ncbi:MAG TPA: 4-hydroxy-3-methylbut-2-enyl diphosphate reductase [Planctomycetota bacterium]|jgi:4-hydroxy-3-methylbut-2-enyl diphosphate reductase|nr:4-hydroxy-3-methylbut-2-enyl diphosphate reductase [Planctomycetota bacterium]
MEIRIAKEIGYCYGVRDAVDMAIDEADKAGGAKVYTFGPIIHNHHTIDMLRDAHNVHTVQSMEEIGEKGATVVIRTHGTTPARMKELVEAGFNVKDATCPFVLKTQRKAREFAAEGYHIVILGHRNHPEVVGIAGQVPDRHTIVDTREDLEKVGRHLKIAALFQSTVTFEDYAWAIPLLAAKCYEFKLLQTICGVTITRQKRTAEVARDVDLMIIIGGKNSSNTKKLVDVSRPYCRTVHIEEPEEIDGVDLSGVRRVGISTGTSTPEFLVDALVERLRARA